MSLSAIIAYSQISGYKSAAIAVNKPAPIAGMDIGGPFALHDQHGKIFTEKNMLGQITLLYFGFTFCPAICPTELQKINIAVNRLGPQTDQVQQVFITVDPDRDTTKVMAPYVAQFNDHLIGLTGSQEEIDLALKAYRVYARKAQDPNMTDYTMDHSSYIYLVGRDGKVLSLFGPDSTADEISAALKKSIHQ